MQASDVKFEELEMGCFGHKLCTIELSAIGRHNLVYKSVQDVKRRKAARNCMCNHIYTEYVLGVLTYNKRYAEQSES